MNETEFHHLAHIQLSTVFDILEDADRQGLLDVEYEGGIMTIGLPDGRQCVLSKHVPSCELWLSSPVSGGLHFSYDAAAGWHLPMSVFNWSKNSAATMSPCRRQKPCC